jgi:hypothetical protein
MAMNINGVDKANLTKIRDNAKPPTPQVQVSIAFERAAPDATFTANQPPPARTFVSPRVDPAYIQFGNVEAGTKIQMLNLSAKPNASWSNPQDVVELHLTGRDVANRQASAYLKHEDMERLDLKAGHQVQFRAVDEAGNASDVATTQVQATGWQNGRVREREGDRFVENQGAQFNMLDGDEGRQIPVTVKTVIDTSAPIAVKDNVSIRTDERFLPADVQLAAELNNQWGNLQRLAGNKASFNHEDFTQLSQQTSLPESTRRALTDIANSPELFKKIDVAAQGGDLSKADGIIAQVDVSTVASWRRNVTMHFSEALEPRATVNIQNQRTGAQVSGTMPDTRQLDVALPDPQNGDPLYITFTDANGVPGKPFMVTYNADTQSGVGPPPRMPVLPGVIETPRLSVDGDDKK